MIMKIRFLAALAPVVAGGVNARGVENLRAHDSKDDGEWHPDLRIIGGSEAIEDRFSYAVSLQNEYGLTCGGSLIAKDVVLTAAHCGPARIPRVVLGRHALYNSVDGEVFEVRKQVSHPEYGYWAEFDNDFMLVFLEGAPTADNVITVKLNSDPLVPSVGQDVTVMGWGDTDIHILNVELSAVLMNFDTSVISNQECDAIERISGLITDNMLCTRPNSKANSCQGDSGGPMVIKGDDGATDVQVGVVSWANHCQTPDVYARVSQAYGWIQSEVCRGSNYATEAGFNCSSISTSPPISPPSASSCIDTVGWEDSYGDGCDWYEANDDPGCPTYGSGDYGGMMGVADVNCCWCMKG